MDLKRADAERFYRDGYIRLPGIVPAERVEAARRQIFERMGSLRTAVTRLLGAAGRRLAPDLPTGLTEAARLMGRSGGSPVLTGLLHETAIRDWLHGAFGTDMRSVGGAQIATLFPEEDDQRTNEAGYLNVDTPHCGWVPHLDGLWNGGIATPAAGSRLSAAELTRWNAEPSTNGARRYLPEFGSNVANFSALVGVALSDQRVVGSGNLGLLRGAHHHIEAFFQWQREQGGPLGPEGPGWPRENVQAPNGHGLVHYPERVRQRYRRGAAFTADGVAWPKPTFMRLRPGDAVVVHHATPHSATRVLTSQPRLMVYFRCISGSRPAANLAVYPDALCDIWLEWPGVRAHCGRSRVPGAGPGPAGAA